MTAGSAGSSIRLGRRWTAAAVARAKARALAGRAAPCRRTRRALGARLSTGVAVFDTLLPLVRGQRIGLFAGSGVGKSSLLAKFARGVRPMLS
jgi:flagellum-specific ATP synthase